MVYNEQRVRTALKRAWSLRTAKQWTLESPESGQCNVTAAVVFDLFGGRILRTSLPSVDHYYNEIDGKRVDLTDAQFPEPIDYEDIPSTRDEAMYCLNPGEYDELHRRLLEELES